MKKYLLILLVLVLVGCSNSGGASDEIVTPGEAMQFEIVEYMDTIAPIYMEQVPYIAYAKADNQLEFLKAKFHTPDVDIDMDKYFAVFLVTQSDSCGIVVDGVYNDNNKVAVQLIAPTGEECEVDPMNHTFVLKVAKADYEKVQLYNGNIMKSSMDVE